MDFTGVPYGIQENILVYGADGNAMVSDAALIGSSTFSLNEISENEFIPQDVSSGEFQLSATILMDGGDRYGVSSVHVDTIEELVWTGNTGGHVTSYYNACNTSKYTSFQVHMSEDIRDLAAIEVGVLCLTPTTVNLRSRFGLPQYTLRSDKFENLQTLCHLHYNNSLLLGGHQSLLIEYDLETQQQTATHTLGSSESPGDCVILREHQRFVAHGERNGKIVLHDPRTLRQEHEYHAHSASLSDFDVQGNFIASCGYTNRMGRELQDQLMMVYDMRMMKLSLPLRCAVPAYLLRFVPGLSSCVAAVTNTGLWNMLDIMQPEMLMLHANSKQNNMMHGSFITSMSVASSSQAVLFGDSLGHIHMWTQGAKPSFNNFSRETFYPSLPEPLVSIPITDEHTPLSTVPLDIPTEPLLSDWPAHLMKVKYRPTPPIDSKILANMNMNGPVGYCPNPFGHNRNVVARRYRRIEVKYGKLGIDDFDFDFYNRTSFAGLEMSLPNSYCNSMLQVFYYIAPLRTMLLSHLCSREFCLSCELGFLFHMLDVSVGQGTPCNAGNFLRAFRTIPEASAMSLTLADNDSRTKVNLSDKIMRWNCFALQQISNEIQNSCKDKAESSGSNDNVVNEIFGCEVSRIHRCSRCDTEHTSTTTSRLHLLSLHHIIPECRKNEAESVPFSKVVEAGLCQSSSTQAWCEQCNKYQPQQQLRKYHSLPNVLVLNTGLDNQQDLSYWQEQLCAHLNDALVSSAESVEASKSGGTSESGFAKASSSAPASSDQFFTAGSSASSSRPCRFRSACVRPDCKFWHPGTGDTPAVQGEILHLLGRSMEHSWVPAALRAHLTPSGFIEWFDIPTEEYGSAADSEEGVIYDLMAVVSLITDPRYPDKNNLVATIKVGASYHERCGVSPVAHWYLFNDISIVPITTHEAVWFPAWKQPCVMYWIRRTLPASLTNFTTVCPITESIFVRETVPQPKQVTFMPLKDFELPNKDDLVAMDAEFVNLHQEEAEIRSDGTRSTVRPSHKAVARITCVRGWQEPLQAVPFLDDYISTQERVVDYLTQFSGIKPGDLDANFSQKNVTHLKTTYVKLRYLVDKGVKFVGHGLKNDFRVINMVVPPHQLLDTLHLFHLPHNRMVSLKFLAWYFLKLKIQSITHDSIEDARTALALYQRYLQLKQQGTIMKELEAMYETGKKVQWQVPDEEGNE